MGMAFAPGTLAAPCEAVPIADRLARTGRRARLLVLALLAALVVLSLLPMEGAVIAVGEVSPESREKVITHDTGGVLTRVLVKEGQRVAAGQPLVSFDRSVLGPAARNAAFSRVQLLALRARLEAERDGRTAITFPDALASRGDPEARAAIAGEQRQFTLGLGERASNASSQRQQIRQADALIASYEVQIEANRKQLALIGPELEGLRGLRERGLVTVNRLNQMERTAVELTARVASLETDIARARAQVSQIEAQIANAAEARRARAGEELADVIAQLGEQDTRAVAMQNSLDRTVITAPQAGIVDQIHFTTVGSFVPPNVPLVRLVPEDGRLLIEAKVRLGEVDSLREGQAARVRFATLDRALSPEIGGRVTFIAAQREDDPEIGASYYRLRVAVDERDLAAAVAGDALRSGQPVEVYLSTGSRSILAYLLKPLLDQMRKAVRE
jgi:HlyD family secretion protein